MKSVTVPPTQNPTNPPSNYPTLIPTKFPSLAPTKAPTIDLPVKFTYRLRLKVKGFTSDKFEAELHNPTMKSDSVVMKLKHRIQEVLSSISGNPIKWAAGPSKYKNLQGRTRRRHERRLVKEHFLLFDIRISFETSVTSAHL